MFNAGVRGKRAKDGVGFLSTAEQFNQKSFLVPTVTSFSVTDVSYVPLDDTAVDTAGGQTIVINGSGFAPGATVQVGATTIGSVTFIDQGRLAFAAPALSSGSYTIYVTNSNGGTGILVSGLVYSGLPTFSTSAGSLGTVYETANINTSVTATGDAPITYTLLSGTLPSGATLNSNGTITGNAPVDGSSTTYSFTIQASDVQLQDSTRSFSLTINTDVLSWSLANNTTYTLDGGTAMSNVTLSATSSANSNSAVTFAANTLPTGVSLSGNTIYGTPTTEGTTYSALTATATQTGRTATRFVSWTISVADAYFKYTTLAINSQTTSNSTFVQDASTNNFAVTINGDTKPNNFNPYTPGYYSNYFDNTGDYLSVPASSNLSLGTGDFTIEAWVYNVGGFGTDPIFECRSGSASTTGVAFLVRSTGSLDIYNSESFKGSSSTALTSNQWYHVVYQRTSGTLAYYINGTAAGGFSGFTANLTDFTSYASTIAGSTSAGENWEGYISNLRVIKGQALFSGNFTPSTSPLTTSTPGHTGSNVAASITGTVPLLTCQSNRFIDNSTNNFTITRNGDTSIKSFDPFVPNSSYSTYGSGYFDGTGDYLSVPNNAAFQFGTGDFTVEYWVNFTTTPGASSIIPLSCWSSNSGWELYYRNNSTIAWYYNSSFLTGTTTPKPNTWYHLAVTRSSGTTRLFVNGAIEATLNSDTTNFTPSSALYIGNESGSVAPFTGYLTDVRIVKGTAVYTTAFTPPSAPLTAIANTSLLTLQNNQPVNNNVFLDNSTNNLAISKNGNATQGTFSPYGGNWSNYFDGTGDMLQTPSITIGTNAFCFECWLYPTVTQGTTTGIFVGSTTDSLQASYYGNPGLGIATKGTAWQLYEETTLPTVNAWNHVAFVRSGTGANQTSIYINGVRVANGTVASNFAASVYQISTTNAGGSVFQGYISNARLTNGSTPYDATQSTITVPTTPLTPITNTSLLTCQSNRLMDNSINNFTLTKNGDVSVQRFSPFSPSSLTPTSYSGYFDGSGDYLNAPSNAAFGFGTGDFTIEGWFYFTGTISTYQRPWWFGDDNDNIEINSSVLKVGGASQGTLITGGTTILANTWYHIALTRASGSYKLWLNGTQQGSTATNSYNSSTRTFTLMATSSGVQPSTGYVSNLRIVKGTALYTATFTPSTTPLTAVSGTSLLTCQSPTFIDNSTNNFTITAYGNSQPTQQNPFGYTSTTTNGYTPSTIGGSAYLDGSGDYLTVASSDMTKFGTGDFTVECWAYATSNPHTNGMYLFSSRTGSFTSSWVFYLGSGDSLTWYTNSASIASTTTSFKANQWYHFAYSRSGTTGRLFVNGVAVNTVTDSQSYGYSTPLYIGASYDGGVPFQGYISDARVVRGTALYTSNFVPPSATLTAVQNTGILTNFTNAAIADYSTMNNLETVGDAKISTAVTKFGGSSLYFDGTGDYLLTAPNNDLEFGSGDFTIEFWLYRVGTGRMSIYHGSFGADYSIGIDISSVYPYTSDTIGIWASSNGTTWNLLNADGGGNGVGSIVVAQNTWTHVAFVRSGTTWMSFINGVRDRNVTGVSGSVVNRATYRKAIGPWWNTGSFGLLNGYIDDLRFTKGYARYTSNFTPPTTTFKTK